MVYTANAERYAAMKYRRCGGSGLLLPEISLGLWQNFGGVNSPENCRAILLHAFDSGVTHFDLANNYGPPPGSAEETFGKIFKDNLAPYRDEMVVSSKAGYDMWPGPYGNWGSRKYLMASCDQSLKRLGIDYLDIFYHHRPDPQTPLEETMTALADIVRQGKALYAGISNYNAADTLRAIDMLRLLGVPCLIHQTKYSMLFREPEKGLLEGLAKKGCGCICFSPLAQGLLTEKYLKGIIPEDSRASRSEKLQSSITPDLVHTLQDLNGIARQRGSSLSSLAISWLLRDCRITSVLVGVSSVEQLDKNLAAAREAPLSAEELSKIEEILSRLQN
jgi:L-glyceraldehyde 3-phosphate reductase